MQIEKIFELTELYYNSFVNRGDNWPLFPPQMSWDKYARKFILNNGSANFNEAFVRGGYRWIEPRDKVTLYCSELGYFATHYYSSLEIFQNNINLSGSPVLFIDFGCGPATSGLSFIDSFNNIDIEYIGIDTSVAMIERAKKFIDVYQVKKYEFHQNFNELNGKLFQSEHKVIVLNFSFLLANETFTGDLESLLNVIQKEVKGIIDTRIIFVYQNPLNINHANWQTLKEKMRAYGFTSKVLNNQLKYYHAQQRRYFNTHFDILTN